MTARLHAVRFGVVCEVWQVCCALEGALWHVVVHLRTWLPLWPSRPSHLIFFVAVVPFPLPPPPTCFPSRSPFHPLQELFVSSHLQPRVFSMQKIVEVADFNMDARPRVVWAKVWDVLSKFFARVGCHRNHSIAMFAIDSLKQLSLKFLEKVRHCAWFFHFLQLLCA